MAKAGRSGLVEEPFFLEGLEGVGVEHFRPDIAVVARRVAEAAGENVEEVGASVADDDLGDEPDPVRAAFSKARAALSVASVRVCQSMSR